MGKFFGKVGYATIYEKTPGVWIDSIYERPYYGDVLRNTSRWQNASGLNDDLTISTQISIIADAHMLENFSKIKYCEHMGTLWKVTSIEPRRPRLILTLGGEWNGEQARTSSEAPCNM